MEYICSPYLRHSVAMKKIILGLIFLGSIGIGRSQNASVEESIFGIQTGILGIWAHNESKLGNSIALRTELGLDAGIFGGSRFYDGTGYLLVPTITVEPGGTIIWIKGFQDQGIFPATAQILFP